MLGAGVALGLAASLAPVIGQTLDGCPGKGGMHRLGIEHGCPDHNPRPKSGGGRRPYSASKLGTVAVSYTTGGKLGVSPGTNQLFITREDGSDPRQLTTCVQGCVQPSWSPDNSQIVYAEESPSGMQLRVIKPNATAMRALTTERGYNNMLPSWINTTHIVWARQRGGGSLPHIARCLLPGQHEGFTGELMVMDTRTTKAQLLFAPKMVPAGSGDSMPSVSPDVSGIVYLIVSLPPAPCA
jgi:hypothetical protein